MERTNWPRERRTLKDAPDHERPLFISYSRKNRDYVELLAAALTDAGLEVWFDPRLTAGRSWAKELVENIRTARAMVLVLTPDSVASDFVEKELHTAQEYGKVVVPLLREECSFPYMLKGVQWVEARGREIPVAKILDTLAEHERLAAKTPPTQPAESASAGPPQPMGPRGRQRWPVLVAVGLLLLISAGVLVSQGIIRLRNKDGTERIETDNTKTALGKEIENSIGLKLVHIPAGRFKMGSPENETTRVPYDKKGSEAQQNVEITQPFYLGKFEVTQEEYEKVMGKNPSWFSAQGGGKEKVAGSDTRNFPVETVSWEDAVAFCRQLSDLPAEKAAGRVYVLPTEAEWEYACRGGAASYQVFHYGNSLSSQQANFYGDSPYGGAAKGPYLGRTTKVGSYQPNAFGLHDMHGNVWEWCADWYDKDYYRNSDLRDPKGPNSGERRVLRGGAWDTHGWCCRAAFHLRYAPGGRGINFGFRVVLRPGVRTP